MNLDTTMRTPTKGFTCLQDVSMDHNKKSKKTASKVMFLDGVTQQHAAYNTIAHKREMKIKAKYKNARKRERRAKVTLRGLRNKPGKAARLVGNMLKGCADKLAQHGYVKMEQVRKGKKRTATEEKSNTAEWRKRRSKLGKVRTLSSTQQSRLKHTRGDRRHFMTKALLMNAMLYRESRMAAGRVKPSLDLVCKHMFTSEVHESWASESTILRTARLIYKVEIIQLREHLEKAIQITVRWDLSPQAHQEFLAIFISAAFRKSDTPPEFKESGRATGSPTLDIFNFVLPLQQCANKRAITVEASLRYTLR